MSLACIITASLSYHSHATDYQRGYEDGQHKAVAIFIEEMNRVKAKP